MNLNQLKIAIVCDWLTNMGGAEKVILSMHELFPNASIYTSLYNGAKMKGFENARIITSYLQKIPGAKTRHQLLVGLMPRAFEKFNLDGYDIVLSSSHACAKGIITSPSTLHICYCHSPMRYAWENSLNYIKEYKINALIKKTAPFFIHKLRMWDRLSADRADCFITNSGYVRNRIHKYYRRPADVIHPAVDTSKFTPGGQKESFYLAAGRLTPYKKFDLIIKAFNELKLPLKIAGTGVAKNELQKLASSNIEFLDYVSDDQLINLYRSAKALIFPQVEDFGIIPLETMACGTPVIAYAAGGALETVIDGKTGIFFEEQQPEAVKKAVLRLEKTKFNPKDIRAHAENFSTDIFKQKLLDYIGEKWKSWHEEMNTNK